MRRRALWLLPIAVLFAAPSALHAACTPPTTDSRPEIAIETVLGTIRLRLLGEPGEAPATVANFLNYANRGDYDGSFFHRMVPGFVLQGGGYTWDPIDEYQEILPDDDVDNEYGICNLPGTVAMAKKGNQPDSATSQFFFNLSDNTTTLGSQNNGGSTVFADVVAEDLPVLEVLERNPDGWGCIQAIWSNPTLRTDFGLNVWLPEVVNTCPTNDGGVALGEALSLARADFAPQFPERLVMVQSVPEPLSAVGAAAAVATLGGLRRRRLRRTAIPV